MPESWHQGPLPTNVHLLGHVGEEEKLPYLSSSWLLVNTSIHEGSAISFLEALSCEMPLLGCQDPEGIVSKFGIFVGRHEGSGMQGSPALIQGLQRLLSDDQMRLSLGKNGRSWVNATHSRSTFLASFRDLCAKAKLNANSLNP